MRIALVGTRGVPAKYGGFETAVEEVGKRLAERGHVVTVYCRRPRPPKKSEAHPLDLADVGVDESTGNAPDRYLGMDLIHLPAARMKSLAKMRSCWPLAAMMPPSMR